MEQNRRVFNSYTLNEDVQELRASIDLLRKQFREDREEAAEIRKLMRAKYATPATQCSTSIGRPTSLSSNAPHPLVSNYQLSPTQVTDIMPDSKPRPTFNVSLANSAKPRKVNMQGGGKAKPSRASIYAGCRVNLDSGSRCRPMAKLKAPGLFESQVLSESKRGKPAGFKPSPSQMYCAVKRIRRQRVRFFREQLDQIEEKCTEELEQIELGRCQLTPLIDETSTWSSSMFLNSSQMCGSVSPHRHRKSQCLPSDRPVPIAVGTFKQSVSNDSTSGCHCQRRCVPDGCAETSRSSHVDVGVNQDYNRNLLTQSSQVNSISYNSTSNNFGFNILQQYNKSRPPPQDQFSEGSYATQNPGCSRCSSPSTLKSTNITNQAYTEIKYSVNRPASSSTANQPSSSSRLELNTAHILVQEDFTQTKETGSYQLRSNTTERKPKIYSCRFNPIPTYNDDCFHHDSETFQYNKEETEYFGENSSTNFYEPVITGPPSHGPSNSTSNLTSSNFNRDGPNSSPGPSTNLSRTECEALLADEENWFDGRKWTLEQLLSLDAEVTRSMWETYHSQVRDLTSDILRPFLSESGFAYFVENAHEHEP